MNNYLMDKDIALSKYKVAQISKIVKDLEEQYRYLIEVCSSSTLTSFEEYLIENEYEDYSKNLISTINYFINLPIIEFAEKYPQHTFESAYFAITGESNVPDKGEKRQYIIDDMRR